MIFQCVTGRGACYPLVLPSFPLVLFRATDRERERNKKKIPKLFIQSECIFSEEYSEEERV